MSCFETYVYVSWTQHIVSHLLVGFIVLVRNGNKLKCLSLQAIIRRYEGAFEALLSVIEARLHLVLNTAWNVTKLS